MRTLIYCTAYAAAPSLWQTRYRRWLDAVLAGFPEADQILLVDDGSPTLPGWADTQLFSGDAVGEGFTVGPRGRVLLFHFREHLGRPSESHFPGWHRSYVFGALYGEANGFDRIIHLESDAFIISERARLFIRGFNEGWAALWSPHYAMPEIAVSVAAGPGLRTLAQFARAPYAALTDTMHEHNMPFTHIIKSMTGDRYSEISPAPIPADADYAAQVAINREPDYYWFLPGRPARPEPAQSVTLIFGEGGSGLPALDGGWAEPEMGFHWMLGTESILRLPALPGDSGATLRMQVYLYLVPKKLVRQRLIIDVNGRRIVELDLTEKKSVIGCAIPAAFLRPQGSNLVRLIHPDGAQPSMVDPPEKDARRLSVSLDWLMFER